MSSNNTNRHDSEGSWDAPLSVVAQIIGTSLSNRGLSIAALLACALLSVGPWLRPAISRDFRGVHIPWTDAPSVWFFPQFAAEVPRAWQWGSIAVPLLTIVAMGLITVVLRPRWTCAACGLLLAASIPATAATFWNHPVLMEFFEGEVRERALLRVVFRHQSEDMLASGAPDRLAPQRGRNTQADYLSSMHPVLLPFRYAVYGPWIIGVSMVGTVLASSGRWRKRFGYVAGWTAIGVIFAAALTWPRWLAEHHWLQADAHENAHRFDRAAQSLEKVRTAMPQLAFTRRYWLSCGRLGFRQDRSDRYTAFFIAHQHALANDVLDARALLKMSVGQSGGTAVERELLAEILGQLAATYVLRGDFSAAELAWSEASDLAPWVPAYWIGQTASALAADPSRAAEMEQDLLPRLNQVGDRMINSDFASIIGDAYFKIGDFTHARSMYERSLRNFNLPKFANLHAQQGRLGM